jgi:sulfate permease, SulP family
VTDAETLPSPSRGAVSTPSPSRGAAGLRSLWRREFRGYSADDLRADLIAGLTVAAVALPLALAFGVVSGADAAAGLVTAILAGLIVGGLGGSPYQISGPTGAMSAVLIAVAAHHGLAGVWLAGVIAGLLILLMGILNLGKLVSFIPSPVIVGFTSGIAVIIATGQLPNVLGITVEGGEGTVAMLVARLWLGARKQPGARLMCYSPNARRGVEHR